MKKFFSKAGNFIKWMLIVLLAGSILLVLLFRFVPVYVSPLMFIRAYEQVSRGEQIRWHHEWVPLDSISPDLPLAVMSSEDQNYLIHNGFDWDAIKRVIDERESGERFRGGSTISQQTAKNVFLFPTSSSGKLAWVRKGVEAYFTVLMEFMWNKQRIMEVYLNTIEMGDGIYGAQAVAQEHFGCDAKNLTRNQCALIAVTLPNPIKFNSASPSNYMYRRQTWCLRQMKWLGKFPMTPEEQKEMEKEKK
ncbi:MAG: monofunctional biosynthetic peptidoglycan transglycosylase [Prevotellaceae bacterium]|nr:monofunctional biosynthetic peptidoglycan transglycosylase [Candidatus Minthosoma equi]